jgi:molybdopterin-binding protein
MSLVRLHDAAQGLGISYPTLKQWIYSEKIRSVKTAGGHHRIPQGEIDRFLETDKGNPKSTRSLPKGLEAISGRNKLLGRVAEVRYEGLLAEVVIDIGSGQQMVSIITAASAQTLGLRKGTRVHALVKATEVMVIRD